MTAITDWQTELGGLLERTGATMDAELAGLTGDLTAARAAEAAALAEVDRLTRALAAATADDASDTATISALVAQLATAKDQLTAAQTDLAACQTQLQTTQSQLVAANVEVARLRDKYEPTTPPLTAMRVGTNETSDATFANRTAAFGAEPELSRWYFSSLPTSWPQFGSAQSVISFKLPNVPKLDAAGNVVKDSRGDTVYVPDVAGLLAGKYDAQLNGWLDKCPADSRPKWVIFWHEPEDEIRDGKFTAAQLRAAVAYVKSLIDAKNTPARRIKVGICLMEWTLEPASGRNVNDYLPNVALDFIGWDAYPADRADQDLPNLDRTRAAFTKCRDATKAAGVPVWLILETGTRKLDPAMTDADYDTRQATWISKAIPIADELGARGLTYFDSTVGGDFTIKGPKAKAAMGAAIRA